MPSDRRTDSAILRNVAPLLLLMVVAGFVRFYEIGRLPLWLDEAYSFWFSRQSFETLWTFVPTFETHPPVYYSLLRLWRVFGEDEAALRSLSALFGILCVAAVYGLGRIVGGRRDGAWTGFGAGLIFALSPIHIQYAQEARSSMAVTLAVAIALAGAAWLMRHPGSACLPMFGLRRPPHGSGGAGSLPSPRPAWLSLVGGSAFALWLHNLAPVFVFSVAVAMTVWLAWQLSGNRAFLANGALAALAVVLLWIPWIPWLIQQVAVVSTDFWMKAPTLIQVIGALYFFFGAKYSWPVETYTAQPALLGDLDAAGLAAASLWLAAHLVLAASGGIGLWLVGRRYGWHVAILLASVMVLPILITLAATYSIRPVFSTRALIWVNIPFYVMLAASVTVTHRTWLRGALLFGFSALFAFGSLNYYVDFEKEPWDQIAELLSTEARPGEVVLVVPNAVELPLAYYLGDLETDLTVYGVPDSFPAVDLPNPYPAGITAVPGMTPADLPALRARLKDVPSGWLIVRAASVFDPEGLVARTVAEGNTVSLTGRYAKNNIIIYRFEKFPLPLTSLETMLASRRPKDNPKFIPHPGPLSNW